MSPEPISGYSQAIVYGDLIFVSGQLPIDSRQDTLAQATIEAQTEQAIDNLAAILRQAGSELSHVLKTTLYIADMAA